MAYSTIVKPQDYFNTKLYTGTGSNQSLTGVGFQPDLIWWKCRNSAKNHGLTDAVRGNTKIIRSNETSAESTDSTYIQSFDSDGTTIGSNGNINSNGDTFCLWNWKANGAGSANTDGSINSTVSVNTTAGFSIVSYTGNGTANSTVGHGLGATPKFIIIKPRSAVGYWCVTNPRFVSVSDPNILYLQLSNGGEADDTNINGTTAPSSTVFGVDDYGAVNTNGQTQIAYCFTPIQGYSKFGTYVGNGNADGTFTYLGFKPAFVMIKLSTAPNENWAMYDNKRDTFNSETTQQLRANSSSTESASTSEVNLLSNGFKVNDSNAEINSSGQTYIYMAFAEEPLVANSGTDGVPATAR